MSGQIDCDVFLRDVGKYDLFNCPLCGSVCDVKRNSSVKFIRSSCDIFTCPNGGKRWHYKIYRLKLFLSQVPSKQLRDLVKQDIEVILSQREQ